MLPAPRKRSIGNYEVGARLGAGGQGEVFRATDSVSGELVALKLFRLGIDDADMAELRRRVHREVQGLRTVDHQGVVAVLASGEHAQDDPVNAGYLFVAYELIDGSDLSVALSRPVPPEPKSVVDLVSGLCEGLARAHTSELVHRDIKPSNVRLRHDSWADPVIVDFGCVRLEGASTLTETVGALGTLAYMAPEVKYDARSATALSDQWSLARLVVESVGVALAEGYQEVRFVSAGDLISDTIAPQLPQVARCLERALSPQRDARHENVALFGQRFVAAAQADLWVPVPPSNPSGHRRASGETLLDYFSRFDFPVVDKRNQPHGNLWIIATEESFRPFEAALREEGIVCAFAPRGGKASRYDPAWYTGSSE